MGDSNTGAGGDDHALPVRTRLRWWAWFTFRGMISDRGVDRSAALAYVTLLALVPFLATVAALYRSFFSTHSEAIVKMVTVILPYASETVADTLGGFVRRAGTLGGIASLVFVAVVFRLFLLIETTLNEIWGVAARRSLAVRFFSFTMVLFWGPVVVGLGTTSLLWLQHQTWAPSAPLLLGLGRIVLPLVGLTMVYWLVPHTSVHLLSALSGGITAALGLQLLRTAFVAYLKRFPDINLIFGSLALAVIFLVSLFAFWMLVIIGAEASYAVQNLDALLRSSRNVEEHPPEEVLATLSLLAECYRVLADSGQPPTLDELTHHLSITHRFAKPLLDRLIGAGLVAVTGRDREHYLPVFDADRLALGQTLRLLDKAQAAAPIDGDPNLMSRLREALGEAVEAERRALDDITFRSLLEGNEERRA